MEKYNQLSDFQSKYRNIVIALGMFDGLHIGHQYIIRSAVSKAREIKGSALVFSFSNHPRTVTGSVGAPHRISSAEIRHRIFSNLGVDALIEIPFTIEFAKINAEDFIALLYHCFAPHSIVVGENYTFGHKGEGTPELFRKKEEHYGFRTIICQSILFNGVLVSSTRIRSLLALGDLAIVNQYLGYPFSLIGTVIHGQARGRKLGFPTANIALHDTYARLPHGVYAVMVVFGGKRCQAVANIGNNPTFDGCDCRLEVHVFDFFDNLYEKKILVCFYKKLRDEQRFSSMEDLMKQIEADKKRARRILQEKFYLQENISMVL